MLSSSSVGGLLLIRNVDPRICFINYAKNSKKLILQWNCQIKLSDESDAARAQNIKKRFDIGNQFVDEFV